MAYLDEVARIAQGAGIQALLVHAGQLRGAVVMRRALDVWRNECALERRGINVMSGEESVVERQFARRFDYCLMVCLWCTWQPRNNNVHFTTTITITTTATIK